MEYQVNETTWCLTELQVSSEGTLAKTILHLYEDDEYFPVRLSCNKLHKPGREGIIAAFEDMSV